MDLGDYYNKSFEGFKKNPNIAAPALVLNVLTYALSFVVGIIIFFMLASNDFFTTDQISQNMTNLPSTSFILLLGLIFIALVIILALISILVNASTIGMSKRVIMGDRPELNVALKYGKKYFLKILAVSIIICILMALMCIPLGLGLALDYMYNLGFILTAIGGLITAIGIIVIWLLVIFAYQSIVVGKKSIIGSLKESFKIFKKRPFEIVIVLIINAVILLIIGLVVGVINLFLGIIPILGMILGAIISIAVNTLTFPYFTMVLTYLYMDVKGALPEQDYVH
jgi:hypothetical protein